MTFRRLSSMLLALALVVAVASAVEMAEEQKAVLRDLHVQWRHVLEALPSWSEQGLVRACDEPDQFTGVKACDEEGWVTEWSLDCSFSTSHFIFEWAPAFSRMSHLQSIEFIGCWKGPLDPSWSALTALHSIRFSEDPSTPYDNRISGSIPDSWMSLSNMKFFQLQDQPMMQASIPSWLNGGWPHLERLSFVGVGLLPGTLLPELLAYHPSLTELEIAHCPLTGTIPVAFAQGAQNLVKLHLHGNHLTGPLHLDWTGAPRLQELLLSNNQLEGFLPKYFPFSMKVLTLSSNNFEGSFPPSWMKLSNLDTLTIGFNSLNGTIPADWSALVKLEVLDLGENDFAGSVPSSLIELQSLSRLSLARNHLDLCSSWERYDSTVRKMLRRIEFCDVSSQFMSSTSSECSCGWNWSACLDYRQEICSRSGDDYEHDDYPFPYMSAATSLFELSMASLSIASAVFMLMM